MNTPAIANALYTAAYRVETARAVANSIIEAIPCGERFKLIMDEINHVGYLATAVSDLLGLLKRDIEQLETQLKRGNA